ncbi:PD-(D/E)XK motif protein [Niallia taxi]|nr:PD-(D/E)XK motif protein [Niallia taxi]MDE5052479.1 PD-(D/E)XK motif protein [Niallia taxi]
MKKMEKKAIMKNNPWLGLDRLSRLRVKELIKYNAFWIVDSFNHYGLMIQCDKNFSQADMRIKLKGIDIKLDDSFEPNQLILLLKDRNDWELFLILCNDLINIIKDYDKDLVEMIVKRLQRWQRLLQKKSLRVMTKEEQMGLYSELTVLKDYFIPVYGCSGSINSWVGALGDKQDFLLEKLAVEVKSYRMTSGYSVWISSKEQLNSQKNPLYLLACGINEVSSGNSVKDLVESISEQIDSEELLDEFLFKIEKYGYISEIENEECLLKFRIEKVNGFEVKQDFPKISLDHVSPLINNLKYSIDLSGCSNFEVSINEILI